MLALISVLVSGFVVADASTPVAVCEVGSVALHDLPSPNPKPLDVTYYVDVDPSHHGLSEACPLLRKDLPAGYSAADDAAWMRANVHAPIPGSRTQPTFIYAFSIPKISADGKSATIEWGYTCTGLCGGGLVSHYLRTAHGWRRNGEPQMKWVS